MSSVFRGVVSLLYGGHHPDPAASNAGSSVPAAAAAALRSAPAQRAPSMLRETDANLPAPADVKRRRSEAPAEWGITADLDAAESQAVAEQAAAVALADDALVTAVAKDGRALGAAIEGAIAEQAAEVAELKATLAAFVEAATIEAARHKAAYKAVKAHRAARKARAKARSAPNSPGKPHAVRVSKRRAEETERVADAALQALAGARADLKGTRIAALGRTPPPPQLQ